MKKRMCNFLSRCFTDRNNSYKVDQVPFEFREPFILTGYRHPNSSLKECLRSLFCINNNESINFWTHFLPFSYTFYHLIKTALNNSNNNNILGDNFTWPLFIYLFGICFYLFVSSMAHAFNCMSPIARHVFFILDYMSISVYGMGCSIAYKAYSLSVINSSNNVEKLFDNYVLLALCVGTLGNILSCSSRFILNRRKRSILRTVPFIGQYVFVSAPLLYRFLCFYYPNGINKLNFFFSIMSSEYSYNSTLNLTQSHKITDSDLNNGLFVNKSDVYYLIQLVAALLSGFLYVTHVPERIWPGKFDILGQSHQIFHLTTFICTWSQFIALKTDMNKFIIDNFNQNQIEFRMDDDELFIVKHFDYEQIGFETMQRKFEQFHHSNMPYLKINLTYSFILTLCFLFNFFIFVYYYLKALYRNPWKNHKDNFYINHHHHSSKLKKN
jgi:predicted membrane channel-forming protein YqfA (hemolysin III family)